MKKSQKPSQPTPRPAPLKPSDGGDSRSPCMMPTLSELAGVLVVVLMFVGFGWVFASFGAPDDPKDYKCYSNTSGTRVAWVISVYHGLSEVEYRWVDVENYKTDNPSNEIESVKGFQYYFPKPTSCAFYNQGLQQIDINRLENKVGKLDGKVSVLESLLAPHTKAKQ